MEKNFFEEWRLIEPCNFTKFGLNDDHYPHYLIGEDYGFFHDSDFDNIYFWTLEPCISKRREHVKGIRISEYLTFPYSQKFKDFILLNMKVFQEEPYLTCGNISRAYFYENIIL